MIIQSKYSRQYADPGISFVDSPSLTQQHFRDECDIRKIVAGVVQPRIIPEMSFGDFSSRAASDYQTALNKINEASTIFSSLPSDVRKRFNHDPKEFLKFMGNEENYDEAVSLGLVAPKANVQPSAETVVNAANETANT